MDFNFLLGLKKKNCKTTADKRERRPSWQPLAGRKIPAEGKQKQNKMSGAWYSKVVEKINKFQQENDGNTWLIDSSKTPKVPDFSKAGTSVRERDQLIAEFVQKSTQHILKNITPNFVIMLNMGEELSQMKAAFVKSNDKIQQLTDAVRELTKSNNDLKNKIHETKEQKGGSSDEKNSNQFGALQQGRLSKQFKKKSGETQTGNGSDVIGHQTWA